MENLSEYISQLKKNDQIWEKIKPLVDHIAVLEAELRLAKLHIDEDDPKPVKAPIADFKPADQKDQELTLEERNLYRAVGELAFVIAKADNILRDSERKAFQKVIHEDFGENSWLVEDRFKLIEKTPTSNVESTYNHVIYMIKQNQQGLSQDLVNKFIHVISKVAEVADVHQNQRIYIERFQEDLKKIFHQS